MILTLGEARMALNLATITSLDESLLDWLLPKIDAALINDPTWGLGYDPQYAENIIEYYPRNLDPYVGAPSEGVWDTNQAGTKAQFRAYGASESLQLARLPIRSLDEVRVDFQGGFGQISDTFGNDKVWTAGDDYYLETTGSAGISYTGCVIARRTGWPVEPGSVKVTYKAGYTADELSGRASTGINASDIQMAAMITLIKAFKTILSNRKAGVAGVTAGPKTSERLGDYSYSTDASLAALIAGFQISVPPEAGQKLQRYRHYGLTQ